MSLFNSLGEAPLTRGKSRQGLSVYATEGVLSGTNGVATVSTPFRSIKAVFVQQKSDVASSGDGVTMFTYTVSANVVTVQGWATTSGSDPTMVKATSEATPFSIMVVGIL